jgi:hypothetical protein
MIVVGSINYTTSGRRRKTVTKKISKPKFVPYVPSAVYRRETKQYPSVLSGAMDVYKKDTSMQREISSKYTVAPAYNKGAYQVVSQENIKDIGK